MSVIVRPRVNRSNKQAAAAHTFFANTTIALNKQQMCVCVLPGRKLTAIQVYL